MIGVAVLAIVALVIANSNAQIISTEHAPGSIWPTIEILPTIALGAAVILLVVLVVRTAIRRSRDARDAGK
jgi:hypothetical protein